MKIFSKLFRSSTPLERMRRALDEQRWADALDIGERLSPGQTGGDDGALQALLLEAGDGLARLNLAEAEACLRAGDHARAEDHLRLAAEHLHSSALAGRVAELRSKLGEASTAQSTAQSTAPATQHCSAACIAQDEAHPAGDSAEQASSDSAGHYELILTGYPAGLRPRYLERSPAFRNAFFLAHEDHTENALAEFENLPDRERDDLFYFERGALQARMGQGGRARKDLLQAIDLNPENTLCHETLIDLELTEGNHSSARARLEELLERRLVPGFCHSRLALLEFRSGNGDSALDHAMSAVETGWSEREHLLLTASLLENARRFDEAEGLLTGLSGGGCSAPPNTALGEFWLRRRKLPAKALEIFKGAVRQDPGNPRWPLRMAEACCQLGWHKEAGRLLQKALDDPGLEAELRERGGELLAEMKR